MRVYCLDSGRFRRSECRLSWAWRISGNSS